MALVHRVSGSSSERYADYLDAATMAIYIRDGFPYHGTPIFEAGADPHALYAVVLDAAAYFGIRERLAKQFPAKPSPLAPPEDHPHALDRSELRTLYDRFLNIGEYAERGYPMSFTDPAPRGRKGPDHSARRHYSQTILNVHAFDTLGWNKMLEEMRAVRPRDNRGAPGRSR